LIGPGRLPGSHTSYEQARRFRQERRTILLAVRVSIRAVAFVEVMSGASGAAEPRENAMSVPTLAPSPVTPTTDQGADVPFTRRRL
jgi:hypothetical protein